MDRRLVGLALLLASSCVLAQGYPTKPVRMLVGFPPGAGVDVTSRLVAAKLSETMRRQFIVDNRPGAAGNIAVEVVARASPDGYTLLGMTAAAAVSQSAYSKVPFDLAHDLTPIALIASTPFFIAVHPSLPAKSLKGLIALAKAKPRQLSYGSPGTASSPHLAFELLQTETGINLLHVPYKGTVPAIADTMAGNVSITISNAVTVLPPIKAGRLRPLAVTSLKRSANAPEIPTVAESGVKGFDVGTWYAIAAPAGVPRDIVNRLNRAIVEIVQLPDIREKLLAQGAEPLIASPDAAREFVRNEVTRWARVVKAAGIRLD